MSDQVCAECAGIQANIDHKKAYLVKYELDLGIWRGRQQEFPLKWQPPDEHGLLSTSWTIHVYTNYRENLYITVDLQGDTRQPPVQGFGIKQEVKYDGGLALVDPKMQCKISAMEIYTARHLRDGAVTWYATECNSFRPVKKK